VLAVGLVATLILGCAVGAVPVPLLSVLVGRAELSELHAMVLTELRIPRVMLAAAVGAALATAGAAMQGLFRNPLAEPQLIGVSAGAALGAIAMIVVGEGVGLPDWVEPYALPLAAIAGAALVTTGLYFFAARRRDPGMTTMLLVGIAVNAMAGVGIGLFTWVANDGQLRSLTFWSMGSFGSARWETALPAMVLIGCAIAVLVPGARQLDLLQLGETEARRLGVSVPRLKRRLVFGSAAAVGAGVAVSGVIGFVGLVVPHIARMLGGVHHAYLLPASALLGASLAVAADLGARTLVTPAEMPVGLITSAIGAPFFLWLIARLRAR
jgi:iron complex transport system permease protein